MEGGGRARHGNRIEKELARARDQLLDLTLRNKLLNFSIRSKSAVRVVDEVPREVYGRLVLDEKTMAFKHRPDRRHRTDDDSEREHESDQPAYGQKRATTRR